MTKLGKYTLVRKIATGGMAEVFLARSEGAMGFQKRVVVKRILPHHLEDDRFVQMFLGEATLAAELNHPNLVTIFDFGESDGQYYIAMEYIDGPNLRVLARAVRDHDGPLPHTVAARIIAHAAEGLHSAHELRDDAGTLVNLVHRDISPDNILVSRAGAVKVVDFGIAKSTAQLHQTRSNVIKGKLAYMPPEQLAREPLDRRADIFALGVVLYELLCGAMPFDSTSEVSIIQAIMGPEPLAPVRSRRPDVPAPLDAIISRCIEKDRTRRYQTCKDLQADLERFMQSTGKVVSTSDLSSLVDHLFPPDWEPTLRMAYDGDEDESAPTISKQKPDAPSPAAPGRSKSNPAATPSKSRSRPAPTLEAPPGSGTEQRPALESSGTSGTHIRRVEKSRAPYLIVGLLGAGAVASGLWVALRPDPVVGPTLLDAGRPTATADAAALDAVVAPTADAATAEHTDAAVMAEVDAGALEAPDAAVAHDVTPVAPRTGKVEFRVRPWAVVTVDGKSLGQTPFSTPVTLPVGRHRVRLQNSDLGKDVALELVVKPGENVFKYNFKD